MDILDEDDEDEEGEADDNTECDCDEDDTEADKDGDAVIQDEGDENEAGDEREGSGEGVVGEERMASFSRGVPFLLTSDLLPETLIEFPSFDGLSSQIELALAPKEIVLELSRDFNFWTLMSALSPTQFRRCSVTKLCLIAL